MQRSPRIVAIAGGKGGVGKSTIAANLALSLGKLGHRTLLVDADLGAPNLHTMLGVLNPAHTLAELIDCRVDSLDQLSVPIDSTSARLVCGMSRPGSANLDSDELARLIEAIKTTSADCVLLDVGAGASHQVLDLVMAADVKLVVMTPNLTSLHNAYAMLKACVHRAVRGLAADDTEQSLVDAALGTEHKARTIAQLLSVLRPLDATVAERISETLHRFGVGLIGNQMTASSDVGVLERIGTMIRDHLAIHAPVLSTVPASRSLAGGLRARSAIDDSIPAFRQLAAAVLDVDLDRLRGVSRSPLARRQWGSPAAKRVAAAPAR